MRPNQPSNKPKIFDVIRPGKIPAQSTSKPVIVGHKKVKDSIIRDEDQESRPLMDGRKKVNLKSTVQPTTDQVTPQAETQQVPSSSEQPQPVLDEALKATATELVDQSKELDDNDKVDVAENPEPPQQDDGKTDAAATKPESKAPEELSSISTLETEHPSTPKVVLEAMEEITANDDSSPLSDETGAPVVMVHKQFSAKRILAIAAVVLLLGIIVFNFLLDADVIDLQINLPHTQLF